MQNFRLQKKYKLIDYDSTIYQYIHKQTNMKVVFIENDDKEICFNYCFKTPAKDDKGIAHIIEHSVLSGSVKYRVKDPFKEFSKGSVNTFLNAMTFKNFTMYPAASVLKDDFEHLFKLYTDSVFRPLLTEETFMQEGIRLNENKSFDGIVFNEMLGDNADLSSNAYHNFIKRLYPDTDYRFDSGGDPKSICDLDYFEFLDFYINNYHPGNCILFFYGKLKIEKYLKYLDEKYLLGYKEYEKRELNILQKPFDKRRYDIAFDQKSSIDDNIYLLGFSTLNNDNAYNILTMSILVELLLANHSCPLYKSIIESNLCKDLYDYSGISTEQAQIPFIVGFDGIKEEDINKAQDLIEKTLKDIVKNSFDKTLIESTIRKQRFALYEEKSSSIPTGIILSLRAIRAWISGNDNLIDSLSYKKALNKIEKDLKSNPRFFEDLIQNLMLDNPHSLSLFIKTKEDYKKEIKDIINEKAKKKYFNKEKYARHLKNQERVDTQKDLKKIPLLKLASIPDKISKDPLREEDGIYLMNLNNQDIIYTNLVFDCKNLNEKDSLLLPLLSKIITFSSPKGEEVEEFNRSLNMLIGGFLSYLEEGRTLDKKRVLVIYYNFKCLNKYYKDAVNKIFNYLFNIKIDEKVIRNSINDMLTSFKGLAQSSAHSLSIMRAQALLTKNYQSENLLSTNNWKMLKDLKIDNDLISSLEDLRDRVFKKENLDIFLNVNESYQQEAINTLKEYKGEKKEKEEAKINFKEVSQNAISIQSDVAFNALSINFDEDEYNKNIVTLSALILSNEVFWQKIRLNNGAYGAGAIFDFEQNILNCYTYRDPFALKSIQSLKEGIKELKDSINERNIYEAKIKVMSIDLKPLNPSKLLNLSLKRKLYNLSDEYRLKRRGDLLNATLLNIRENAMLIEKNLISSTYCCSGPLSLLESDGLKNEDIEILPW